MIPIEQIIEGNKLIAKFMEYKLDKWNEKYETSFHELENEIFHSMGKNGAAHVEGYLRYQFSPEEMKFHTSWKWLMPVIEKIENMGYPTLSYLSTFSISKYKREYFEIVSTVGDESVIITNNFEIVEYSNDKITNTWLAVIELLNGIMNK